MRGKLSTKDIISIDLLSKTDLLTIFFETKKMEKLVKKPGGDDRLKGKIMAALFFEPSTRTFSSFIAAMQRLGGGIIPLNGMQQTSLAKGESYKHTIQVMSNYVDCLVIRHPQEGKPQQATGYCQIPIINAGDGSNEHPTQALLDIYTIREEFKQLSGLTVTMIGDLKFGRTVHSLTKALIKMGKVFINFVSPAELRIPDKIKQQVKNSTSTYQETCDLQKVISVSDILYVTRVQKERFADPAEYERLKTFYQLNKKMMLGAKKNSIIMHPLPIAAGEINEELDSDERSLYLTRQILNGLYLRMALLDLLIS